MSDTRNCESLASGIRSQESEARRQPNGCLLSFFLSPQHLTLRKKLHFLAPNGFLSELYSRTNLILYTKHVLTISVHHHQPWLIQRESLMILITHIINTCLWIFTDLYFNVFLHNV